LSNETLNRTIVAQAVLRRVPPLMQATLLKDPEFGPQYGLKTDPVLEIGSSGLAIRRSILFSAVRKVFEGTSELVIIDYEGNERRFFAESREDGSLKLAISNNWQPIILPDLAVLSDESAHRILSLEKFSADVNLPTESKNAWYNILVERPLEDEEVDELLTDCRDTPMHVARSIAGEIREGKSSTSSLVPRSRRYFDRLIGPYDGSISITSYAAQAGKRFFAEQIARQPYEGFLQSLLLSSHSALTSGIDIGTVDGNDLLRAFDYLAKHGDSLSQLGAIEIGLSVISKLPELAPVLVHLIEGIRDDDVEGSAEGVSLLSALFVLVDGELSRTRLFADAPVFYRRLASMAQAALIHRQLVGSNIDETFLDWAFDNRGEQFYWQSLADMRSEPRWNPEFAAADQIKADFIGRIMTSATSNVERLERCELHGLILGTEPNSLRAHCDFPRSYFPGPLEGAEDSPNSLPDDLERAVREQLASNDVGPSSFIALVNSVKIFQLESSYAEAASEALRLASHKLSQVSSQSELLGVLNGLAELSAVTRSNNLATELRILVRRYRRDPQFHLSIDEAARICLVASANRKDLEEWTIFAGDWLTELAFGELPDAEGNVLRSRLRCLLHAVPELWFSCARADAALAAFCSR